jgi:meiotically up-regulated gene 157 (Mug157) protein
MRGLLPYEWDGGDRLLLDDDANVPGLLSLGWLGMADLQGDPEIHGMMKSFGFESAKLDPALFVAGTRAFSLSSNNGQFVPLRGKNGPLPGVPESVPGGLGSAHTPTGMLWPMSLAVASLGEADRDRRMDWLRALAALCPDGQCHESVNPQDPREFTREWFAMGNALTALALIRGVEPEVTEQPEFPGLDIG